MNKFSRILLVVMVMGLAPLARAQSSDTEAPAKPIAGYDKGFYIRSSEGDFELRIIGRLAPAYFYQNTSTTSSAVNTFRIRTAKLGITGTMAKDWGFSVFIVNNTSNAQMGAAVLTPPAATPGTTTLPAGFNWGAEVTYAPNPLFNLAMGIETPPFDRFGTGSSGSRLFIDQSLAVTQSYALGIQDLSVSRPAFGLSNAPGLTISGNVKDRFLYGIGVTNGPNPTGNQDYFSNYNKMFSGGARIQYNILKNPGTGESDNAWSETPALAIGGGLAYEDQGAADASAPSVYLRHNVQVTGDVTFKYKGLSMIGSWYGRQMYCSLIAGNSQFTLQDQGYLAQIGYFVIPKKLEVAARASLIYREGPHNDSSDYYGGINWYIYGNSIKWQTNAGLVRSYDTVDGTNGSRDWRVWSMLMMNI